jgi:alpha-methylacyl-CoA racemase
MGMLTGLRVIELDAIGPTPFCGKLLADHGASVIRIGRVGGQTNGIDAADEDLLLKGRPTIPFDLKDPRDVQQVLALVSAADVLIEGYRPGVMERLGLGPSECLARNPALVYGRMTGYGQQGPFATHAGHDINYVALTGALHAVGDPDRPPQPPLSLVGDFGGGGMLLAFGVLAARLRAVTTGQGEVVDAAIIDGSVQLLALTYGWLNAGVWSQKRGDNILDGGAPFYRTYATHDGQYLAVGAIEPKFYAAFRKAMALTDPLFDAQWDRSRWPAMRAAIASMIATRSLRDWAGAIADPDACLSPVLGFDQAVTHPHIAARETVTLTAGEDGRQRYDYRPAPRFLSDDTSAPRRARTTAEVLTDWPLAEDLRRALQERAEKHSQDSLQR